MLRIRFYAHASFRISSDDVDLITDPYTPGSSGSHFAPIAESADIVLMSSSVDPFHSDPSHVQGSPLIIDAVDVPPQGIEALGIPIRTYQTMESGTWNYGTREAEPNAMYWFEMEGIRFLHMGDLGNPVSETHVEQLKGEVDVMFALAGGQPTISLPDLVEAIDAIKPKVVIPMHYFSPSGVLKILPLEEFIKLYPADIVTFLDRTEMKLERESLPESLQIYVLKQSR